MHETYASRFWKVGGSWGAIIPKDVRNHLGLKPGDLLLMRLFGPFLIMRRVTPDMVIDRETLPTESLPGGVGHG